MNWELTEDEKRWANYIRIAMWVLAMLMFLMLIVFGLTGCSARYWTGVYQPETELKLPGGIQYRNSKDLDVYAEGVEYANGEFKLDKLQLRNNASDVNNSQVAVLQAVAAGQAVQAEYAKLTWAAVNQLAQTVTPLVAMQGGGVPQQQRDAIDRLNRIRELILPGPAGAGVSPFPPAPAPLVIPGVPASSPAPTSLPSVTIEGEGSATTTFTGPSGFP